MGSLVFHDSIIQTRQSPNCKLYIRLLYNFDCSIITLSFAVVKQIVSIDTPQFVVSTCMVFVRYPEVDSDFRSVSEFGVGKRYDITSNRSRGYCQGAMVDCLVAEVVAIA